MDDDVRSRVFDPSASSALALAHRPADCPPVVAVVSGLVRSEVIALLRWTAAGTGDCAALDAGRWWRLAMGCADLLRRLPRCATSSASAGTCRPRRRTTGTPAPSGRSGPPPASWSC